MTFEDKSPDRTEVDAQIIAGYDAVGIEYQDTASATEAEGRAVETKPGQPYEPVDGVGRGEFAVPTEAEQQVIWLSEARAAADLAIAKGPTGDITIVNNGQRVGFTPITEGPFAPISPDEIARLEAARSAVESSLLD